MGSSAQHIATLPPAPLPQGKEGVVSFQGIDPLAPHSRSHPSTSTPPLSIRSSIASRGFCLDPRSLIYHPLDNIPRRPPLPTGTSKRIHLRQVRLESCGTLKVTLSLRGNHTQHESRIPRVVSVGSRRRTHSTHTAGQVSSRITKLAFSHILKHRSGHSSHSESDQIQRGIHLGYPPVLCQRTRFDQRINHSRQKSSSIIGHSGKGERVYGGLMEVYGTGLATW